MRRTGGKLPFRLLVAAFALISLAAATASAQDFSRSYSLSSGGKIIISSVSGDINVTAYDGNQVVVNAFKEGRDRNLVSIEDISSVNTVDLKAKYPHSCNCEASIRFEVMVPRAADLTLGPINSASGDIKVTGLSGRAQLNTASGDLTLTDVTGDVNANTASGDIKISGAIGSVKANTASGDIEARITSAQNTGDMRFNSASGDVSIWAPESIDATVEMSTNGGSLSTDFPLQVSNQEETGSSMKSARGTLGRGSHLLKVSAASGDVSLKRQ